MIDEAIVHDLCDKLGAAGLSPAEQDVLLQLLDDDDEVAGFDSRPNPAAGTSLRPAGHGLQECTISKGRVVMRDVLSSSFSFGVERE